MRIANSSARLELAGEVGRITAGPDQLDHRATELGRVGETSVYDVWSPPFAGRLRG